jgi:hypothetical protein
MSFPLTVLRASRENILQQCDGLTLEQLNHIPAGFNNNLIWNAGHVIATQQLLCYALGGQKTPVGMDFINRYRKGSSPDGKATATEWTFIKDRLFSTIDQFEQDLVNLDFSGYKPYKTSYNVELKNIGQAQQYARGVTPRHDDGTT